MKINKMRLRKKNFLTRKLDNNKQWFRASQAIVPDIIN